VASVTIVLSSDDSRLQAAHERLFRAQEKALENYQKSVNKSKEAQAQAEADAAARKQAAEAEKARLEQVAKGQKIIEGNMTAQERYNAAVAEAEGLAKQQIITEADLARRKEILAKRLFEESGEAKKATQAEAQLTEAHRKAAEVIKSVQTPLERYNARIKELTELQKQGALSAEDFARAQTLAKDDMDKEIAKSKERNGLLDQARDGIIAYGTGIVSASAAANVLLGIFQQITEENKKGFEALKSTQDTDRNLLQISDSPQQFQQLRTESDALSMQTGVDRNAVREVMFQGVSEGFKDAVPEIIKANQVVPVKEAAGVAGQIPALFQGQLKAMEAVDLTLAAAKASRLDFAPLARALPSAAEGGSIAKASPEETLATLSVLASRFKSGEAAADRIKAFSAVAGIDQGGKTEEQKKAEADRVAAAQKELRTKEESVADIQRRMAKPGLTKEAKTELEIKLTRAQRDVQEFDRTRLELPKEREAFAGKGILQVAKELQAMSAGERQKFLGSSQELNAAYNVLVEEMPKIEQQVAELVKERQSFNEGGGILREQVAIANQDKEMTALREESKSQRELEVSQARIDGIAGSAASGAAADATRELAFSGAVTRRMGTIGSEFIANQATNLGATQEQATAAAKASAMSATSALGPLAIAYDLFTRKAPPPTAESPAPTAAGEIAIRPTVGTPETLATAQPTAPNEIRVNDTGISAAADKMAKAAEQMQDAASRMNLPPSIAPAARAQAAGALQ
jgi:hypothetical protein